MKSFEVTTATDFREAPHPFHLLLLISYFARLRWWALRILCWASGEDLSVVYLWDSAQVTAAAGGK